jgi:hypothetical protein
MLRKIVLGVAAAVAIGAAVFSPTTADAKPFKGKFWHPHHHNHFWGGYGSYGAYAYGGGCMQRRWTPTPFGYRFRWVNVCY